MGREGKINLDNKVFWEEQERLAEERLRIAQESQRIAEESLKEANKSFKRALVALIVSGVLSIAALIFLIVRLFIL